jgi:predicted metal-dependent hydrolase
MADTEAVEQLRRRVRLWADRLKVAPRLVRVQRMTRKWGSCSTAGTITLADDLHEQKHGFQDFVIAHELLHLRVPHHGRLFRALLSLHLPEWRGFDVVRRSPRRQRNGPKTAPSERS